ncbi:hypothetical protein LXA43DRAFT_1100280 [Ganoderma leucocontextum]|nr:hypothetical protein LXA43DRAFT_1100280 [Ganoderma leucocontextum]
MKGKKCVQNDPNDVTDDIPGRYTIFDLEGIDNSVPVRRYTIAELAQRLLALAIFEETSGVSPTICIACLRMALGERPCPHGTFPEDPRPCPRLVWPDEERACARDGTAPPVLGSDFFAENRSLLATPPGPSRTQAHSHVGSSSSRHTCGHRSGDAPPASPVAERPTGTPTPVWYPCAFDHQHSSRDHALRCNNQATLNTFEFPPPAPTRASVHRALQVSIGMSDDIEDDAQTSTTGTSTARTPTPRTSATGTSRSGWSTRLVGEPRVTNSGAGASYASAAASRATTRPARYIDQPAAEVDPVPPAEHPLVPIPRGANPIPVEAIHIDDDDPAVTAWYLVTTGSTVGVFDDVSVAQRAAQVSGGSWRRAASSRHAALNEFRRAVAKNTVIVRQ